VARQTIIKLVDDLDGGEANATVSFALDGYRYEIDLNDKHQNELRNKLGPFLEAARRVSADPTRGRGSGRTVSDKERNTAIREWAANEGVEINTRGRIANAVQEAFQAQDGDALRAAFGVELVRPKPRRTRRAQFSDTR
jgi:nucleoid-associated protein Lsr2